MTLVSHKSPIVVRSSSVHPLGSNDGPVDTVEFRHSSPRKVALRELHALHLVLLVELFSALLVDGGAIVEMRVARIATHPVAVNL